MKLQKFSTRLQRKDRQAGSIVQAPERNGPGSEQTGLSPVDPGTDPRRTDRPGQVFLARLRKILLSMTALDCPDSGEPSGFFSVSFCPCRPYIRIGNGDDRQEFAKMNASAVEEGTDRHGQDRSSRQDGWPVLMNPVHSRPGGRLREILFGRCSFQACLFMPPLRSRRNVCARPSCVRDAAQAPQLKGLCRDTKRTTKAAIPVVTPSAEESVQASSCVHRKLD